VEARIPNSERSSFVLVTRARRVSAATTTCLFLTALLVLSIGVIGGVYLYRQFARSQMHRFRGWCSVPYEGRLDPPSVMNLQGLDNNDLNSAESLSSADREWQPAYFKEGFEIDLEFEKYEKVHIPDFRGGKKGRFIHDFSSNKTGIVDIDGQRCFVMPLNRNLVLPPRTLHDLIQKMWNGYYAVDTSVVRETMQVVQPPVADRSEVGPYIENECAGMPIYRLEKVQRASVFKRSADNAVEVIPFVEFAGKGIIEIEIVESNKIK